MTPIVRPVPMLTDNYSWLLIAGNSTALVDPPDAKAGEAAVDAAGGRLDFILLTHHHADHVAGTDELRARFNSTVIGAAADAHRLPRLDRAVKEGDVIVVGDAEAHVLETPGHTIGHISFYVPTGPFLFCGDTLFSLGCGRLFEGTAQDLFESFAKFASLPPETQICCGHEYTEANARFAVTVEPENRHLRARVAEVAELRRQGKPTVPVSLGQERATNPFLRARDPTGLAQLRAQKDRF